MTDNSSRKNMRRASMYVLFQNVTCHKKTDLVSKILSPNFEK